MHYEAHLAKKKGPRNGAPRWIGEDGRLLLRKAPEQVLRAAMALPGSGVTKVNVAEELARRSEVTAKRRRKAKPKRNQKSSIYETGATGRPFGGGAPK